MPLSREFLGRQLFGLFHEESYTDESTLRTLWKVLAWSFEALAQGRFPACDHEGRPWPEGDTRAERAKTDGGWLTKDKRRGVYVATTGDWKWTRYTFGMKRVIGKL